jgi:hypothetical protein
MNIDTLNSSIEVIHKLYTTDISHLGFPDKISIWSVISASTLNDRVKKVDTLVCQYGINIYILSSSYGVLSIINSNLNAREIADKSADPETVLKTFEENKNFVDFIYSVDRNALLSWINEKFTQEDIDTAMNSGECNFCMNSGKSDLVNNSTLNMEMFLQNNSKSMPYRKFMSLDEIKSAFARK